MTCVILCRSSGMGFVAREDGKSFHSIGARLRSIRRDSTLSRKGEQEWPISRLRNS
jgi:hypothetical protein